MERVRVEALLKPISKERRKRWMIFLRRKCWKEGKGYRRIKSSTIGNRVDTRAIKITPNPASFSCSCRQR
jgi:hypothetical protein